MIRIMWKGKMPTEECAYYAHLIEEHEEKTKRPVRKMTPEELAERHADVEAGKQRRDRIEAFLQDHPPSTVNEIAQSLGIPGNKVQLGLASLKKRGHVGRTDSRRTRGRPAYVWHAEGILDHDDT